MRHLSAGLAALVLAGILPAPAWCAADAVEELRLAIPVRRDDPSGKAIELTAKYREKVLQERIDALRKPGDLRRALTLREWKDDPALDLKLQEQNSAMRAQIGRRLESALKAIADKPGAENATSRLAVANLIAELGPEVPDLNEKDRAGFARTLTPIAVKLAQDPDLGVKQEALRALGTINPAPADAAAVYRKVLGDDREAVGARRVAADGLGQLIRVVLSLEKRTGGVVIVSSAQKLETIKQVANSASAALSDADAQVRALGLTALQSAAQALGEMIDKQRLQSATFPPPGRQLTPDEVKYIQSQQADVFKEIMDLETELTALNNQGANLQKVLGDSEPRVQLMALQALESIGYTRLRLRHLAYKVPDVKGNQAVSAVADPLKKALAATDPLGNFLKSNGLAQISRVMGGTASQTGSDHPVKVRRAAMDFLATLDEDAAPALSEITRGLTDPDRFVRWSAVMVLENMPPASRVTAVSALAQLLSDQDLNVRLEATKSLSRLGNQAAAARTALIQAIDHGDVEARVAAMRAVEAVGVVPSAEDADTKQFLSRSISSLAHTDPRMRRASAETLGRLGTVARSAVPALRKCLGDEDDEVRARASEALLSILEGDTK